MWISVGTIFQSPVLFLSPFRGFRPSYIYLGGEDLSTALNIINFSYLLLTKSRKYAMFVLK
jgi:hypothetical protein